jgi:hypothetical protein
MPAHAADHVKNIALCVVLSLVTCGLYNVYWQYTKILAVNDMLQREKYAFVPWLLLSLVTCGLYHFYHQYRLGEDIAQVSRPDQKNDGLVALVLSILGLTIIVDAIQQSHINAHYGDDSI